MSQLRLWPWKRQPSAVDRLAADVEALGATVDSLRAAVNYWAGVHNDDQDELLQAAEQREGIERLVAGVKKWALSRGFSFAADAPSGSSPMSQRAARQALAVKGENDG